MLGIKNSHVCVVYCANMTGAGVNQLAAALGLEMAIRMDGGPIAAINGTEAFALINLNKVQNYLVQVVQEEDLVAVWEILGGILTLLTIVGLFLKPLLKLNTSITRLTDAVASLQRNLDELTTKNTDSHARIWAHEELQDKTLNDHETRISVIEKTRE